MRFAVYSTLSVMLLAASGYSHLYESFPYPRGSPDNPKLSQSQVDVNIHGPTREICRGLPAGDVTYNLQAGETLKVKIQGPNSAPPSAWALHSGGHCQWGVSYDNGKTVAVFHRHDNTCGVQNDGKFTTPKTDWEVPIPKNLVNAKKAVFVWTWIPASGGAEELFQSCVDVSISKGKASGTFTGDSLVYRNFPGWPDVPDTLKYTNGKDPDYKNFLKDIHPITIGPGVAPKLDKSKSGGGYASSPSATESTSYDTGEDSTPTSKAKSYDSSPSATESTSYDTGKDSTPSSEANSYDSSPSGDEQDAGEDKDKKDKKKKKKKKKCKTSYQ